MTYFLAKMLQKQSPRGVLVKNKTCVRVKKETLAQVFSGEFCEISKNTFFHRIPLVASSEAGGCF